MVNATRINHIVSHPEMVSVDDLELLESSIKSYPYFQAARSVYLKVLKNQSSSLYNKELQRTAAHTADRSVLFDFITSDSFHQLAISDQIKQLQDIISDPQDSEVSENLTEEEIDHSKNVSLPIEEDFNASKDFSQVTDIDLFEKKRPNSIVNEPLEFKSSETYSFSQWLQLTSLHPIDRSKDADLTRELLEIEAPEVIQEVDERARKMARIDQFLAEKPKIRPRKTSISNFNVADLNQNDNLLMTETLAKVYLAQKNYSKALKAYEILILQHPEKSGLFADQIQEIKNLQSNNT